MSRERILAAVAAAAILGIGGTAGAHGAGSTRSQCISVARKTRSTCVQGCDSDFKMNFLNCFGSSKGCAQTCLSARMTCESGPRTTENTCADDSRNPQSCRSRLQVALGNCKHDPDPEACNDEATLAALKCRQACQDVVQPQIDNCEDAAQLCLQGCPGGPTTSTSMPRTTTTTTLHSPHGAFLDQRLTQ